MLETQQNYTEGVKDYITKGKALNNSLAKRRSEMSNKRFDTIAVHGIYNLESALANQGSVIEPAFLSSAQCFENSDHMEAALAYLTPAWAYTRVTNPSLNYLEETLALLEAYKTGHETSCHVTSSGMSAVFMATNPFLAKCGHPSDEKMNIVVSAKCYGGTFMLFSERYGKEQGIDVRWVKDPLDLNEWDSKIDENTRFVYGEMPSNPSLGVFDIEKVAELAHNNDLPLLVDSTLATPALLRPIQFGADIVIHSVSKTMSASGFSIAGALVSKKNIPSRIGPDEMKADFALYVKLAPARDFGPSLSPFNAIMSLNEVRSIRSRLAQMSESSLKVAKFLQNHPNVESVNYPGLEDCETHDMAKKYMHLVDSEYDYGRNKNAYGHLMSFCVKGGHHRAREAQDKFDLIAIATDLGRIKTIANIPSISTHQQQGEAGREIAEIPDNMIRLSVGFEDPHDLIKDLDQALS